MEKNNVEVKPVKKERMNIYLFSILMFVAFVATFYMVHIFLSNYFYNTLLTGMHTYDIIGEAILAILVFVVLLLWKNSYVFTQKREGFFQSLRYGWFYILLGCLFILMFGLGVLDNVSGVINTAIFAFLVGIYEEFLCRGWLLNEFLERYGDTKKGVWVSIVASGIIFGLIHFINVSSQGFAGTLTQVLNASATGILWGFIYYKTKNIWTVVFLHGFWDFSLFLADLSPVTEITTNIAGTNIVAIIGAILLVACELMILFPFRKDIDAKVEHGKIFTFSIIAAVGYFVSMMISGVGLLGQPMDTYEIGGLSMSEYSVVYDNYETYALKEEIDVADEVTGDYVTHKYSFSLYKTDSMLVFKNDITGKSVNFDFSYLYDYALHEFREYYLISYIDIDDDGNIFLKYHYLNKAELSNEESYLQVVKSDAHKYLVSQEGELTKLIEKETGHEYLAVDTANYGYFVLVDEENVSILNRD